jgi:hypothetical protein
VLGQASAAIRAIREVTVHLLPFRVGEGGMAVTDESLFI